MIEISGVSHSIGAARILHDVSLQLPAGGITALVGPNGAGKSTLLHLIARLDPVQAGRITVDGLDVNRTPTGLLARKLAILAQQTHIGSRLRVRDLVGFGRYPHHHGRPRPEDEEATEAALREFDLLPLAGRFLDSLSGGQQQRAHLAMVFAQGTDWLLLDEPLNNLDMYHARALMRRLRDVAQAHGRSVVIVVHEINYAAAYADHIVALKHGRVAAVGTPEEVLCPVVLESVFDMPMRVHQVDNRPLVLHHV
ncbi:ABC transporter ATP-binding protein [Plastorhodobacter daqingensis]|uniref:ABC transporter ATP-binding protein n=1 Tax=Plastorhodobacter daqingensis TaxID=1387281 RepID=A0ABW2UMA3_9RHOB